MSFNKVSTQSLETDARRTCVVVALRSLTTGTEFPLLPDRDRWAIGSSSACEIVVDDPCISSVHCSLERRDGVLVVRDRQSRNGTYLDNSAIECAELRVGAYLKLGRTTLVAVGSSAKRQKRALEQLLGHAPAFRATVDQALRAAQSDCNVLIVGETGTGKDLLATLIHESSRRVAHRYVAVNCGAIPRELIASELFGHERGAFTGAHADRDGYFFEASGGTLFLDELGELPIEMQPSLLRVIENRTVRRVGGSADRPIDVRIVAATNRVEHLGTEQSRLRIDLYHRVATVVLVLPPMRERVGDLVELVEAQLLELAPEYGIKRVSAAGWKALADYSWPGNVRELRHAVARAVALGGRDLDPTDFFPELKFGRRRGLHGSAPPVGQELVPYESILRGAMEHALATKKSIRAAATHLGMPKSTFAEKARAWGLTSPKKKPTPVR